MNITVFIYITINITKNKKIKKKGRCRAALTAEVGRETLLKRGKDDKDRKAQEEIWSQMLMLTAVFLGSSMAQMFKSRAEVNRDLCKSGKGRSACFFRFGTNICVGAQHVRIRALKYKATLIPSTSSVNIAIIKLLHT